MRTDDFDYVLPDELIAQTPAIPRDSCKLLVMDKKTGALRDRIFTDVLDYLCTGDALVVNNTRVLPARLLGHKAETGGAVEVLLLRELTKEGTQAEWECLVKPGKRLREGARIEIGEGSALTGEIVAVSGTGGNRRIRFTACGMSFDDALHKVGQTPLPPYITTRCDDPELYQTVYSESEHSAAAPTAGLHFTDALLARAQERGVEIVEVELQVGLDTFRTVTVDDPHDHHIHTERCKVSEEAAQRLNTVHARGNKIVAVGTTSVRTLESAWDDKAGKIAALDRDTSLFILPGFEFHVVDALITNFHVPRSSLMMLVSAFSSRENIMAAYRHAIAEKYRMLSFGDAMLII